MATWTVMTAMMKMTAVSGTKHSERETLKDVPDNLKFLLIFNLYLIKTYIIVLCRSIFSDMRFYIL